MKYCNDDVVYKFHVYPAQGHSLEVRLKNKIILCKNSI